MLELKIGNSGKPRVFVAVFLVFIYIGAYQNGV
jgi:hypothetical protein